MDGSELAFTSCGKLPIDNELLGPELISRSDSGLDAYDKRDVFIGNRKSSDRDSSGYFIYGIWTGCLEFIFECLMMCEQF